MQKQSLTTSCQQTNAQPDWATAALEKLLPSLLQHVTRCGMEYQLGQLRAAVPDVFPHNTSPTPSLFLGMGSKGVGRGQTREEQKPEKALMLYQQLLSNSKSTAVSPRLSWSQMPNTAPHQLLWRTLTPSQPDPAESDICFSTHLLHSSSELLSSSPCPLWILPCRDNKN